MSLSPAATILAEQGVRVLACQVMQDDPARQRRVIGGLARNAQAIAASRVDSSEDGRV